MWLSRAAQKGQRKHGFADRARLEQHIRIHREVTTEAAATGAISVQVLSVEDSDAHAAAFFALDPQTLVHVYAVKLFDRLVRALQHPHQNGLIFTDGAGFPEAGLVIDVQAPLVLRLCGQVKPIRAVLLEIADDLSKRCLAVTLVLLVFVDHESPEPVPILRVSRLRGKGEHAEADEAIVRIDRKRTCRTGIFGICFLCLPQRYVIWRDKWLILPYGKGQNRISVIIIYRFQCNTHD